jgi:hypothetical protein
LQQQQQRHGRENGRKLARREKKRNRGDDMFFFLQDFGFQLLPFKAWNANLFIREEEHFVFTGAKY